MTSYLFAFLLTGGILFFMYLRYKSLMESGKITKRKGDFVEQAEDFILSLKDPDEVARLIQELPYAEMKVSVYPANGNRDFQFTGGGWSARLYRKEDEGEKAVYTFQYLKWETHNGLTVHADQMNMLLTAVEKMFLKLDPATQVKTRLLETKTTHKFF